MPTQPAAASPLILLFDVLVCMQKVYFEAYLRSGSRWLSAAQSDLGDHPQTSQLSCGCLLISFHLVAASKHSAYFA